MFFGLSKIRDGSLAGAELKSASKIVLESNTDCMNDLMTRVVSYSYDGPLQLILFLLIHFDVAWPGRLQHLS